MAARELVRQLFEASLHGRTDELRGLAPQVSPGGLASVKDGNGRTALHFAAQGGQTEAALYLLQAGGISLDARDSSGTSREPLRRLPS